MHRMSCKCSIMFFIVVIVTAFMCTLAQAKPDGAVRELVKRRTAVSKHWKNKDGSFTAEIFTEPIHYKDSDGTWKDIDSKLAPSEKANNGYSAIKNNFKAYLAPNARGRQAVEVNGLTFAFSADAAVAPKGEIDGNVIVYPDAWPSVDLKYSVLPVGVKEEIILKSKPTNKEFRFSIDAKGLHKTNKGKNFDFTDSSDTPRFRIPPAFMTDAVGQLSNDIGMVWEEQADGSFILILKPDEDWLSTATYPVVIDPFVIIRPDTGTGADVFYCTDGTTTSYTDNQYLEFGKAGTTNWYTCARWDLSSIPHGAKVYSNGVGLYGVNEGSGDGRARVKEITEWPWPVDRLPNTSSSIWQATSNWSKIGYNLIHVPASVIENWINNPSQNHGILIDDYTGAETVLYAHSSESTLSDKRPRLYVTYDIDDTAPTTPWVKDDISITTDRTQLSASWTMAMEEEYSEIIGYEYTISTSTKDPEVGQIIPWTSVGPTPLNVTHTGLSLPEDTYYFWVKAQNRVGIWGTSGRSDGVLVTSEISSSESYTIQKAKLSNDGSAVEIKGAVVTAVFGDYFYIESDNRANGIRVYKPSHGISLGTCVNINGQVKTNSNYERYVDATVANGSVISIGTGSLSPFGMNNLAVGGVDFNYDMSRGIGQRGITRATGWNNIGLLIKTWGKVTSIDTVNTPPQYLYVDDGSTIKDGTKIGDVDNVGIMVKCDPTRYAVGDYMIISGISSCFVDGNNLCRLLLPLDIAVVDPNTSGSVVTFGAISS